MFSKWLDLGYPLLFCLLPSPDQPSEILSDYIQQSTVGRDVIIHVITYKCDTQVPSVST